MSISLNDDLDQLQQALARLMRAMRPRLWPAIRARAGVALDQPAAALLHVLVEGSTDACHPHTLAERLSVEAPFVTRKVQQLEEAGLVVRHVDPSDRRAYTIQPTALGWKVAKRLTIAKRETLSEILGSWPATERRQLIKLLSQLADDTESFYKHTKQTVLQK